MAIDQSIDFSVPESTIMLAVYLSVPEAENSRRAMNTANGIRRAKQMGRYPSKAPLGFINLTTVDGKKIIVSENLAEVFPEAQQKNILTTIVKEDARHESMHSF